MASWNPSTMLRMVPLPLAGEVKDTGKFQFSGAKASMKKLPFGFAKRELFHASFWYPTFFIIQSNTVL